MSAIHEALKKARNVRKGQEAEPKTETSARMAPAVIEVRSTVNPAMVAWMVAIAMVGVAAFSWQYARASSLQKKLTLALLELNDTRGDYLDSHKKKANEVDKLRSTVEQLNDKIRQLEKDRNHVWMLKQTVEVENLQKEKKISEITKQKHDLEMTRWRLSEELDELKKEIQIQPGGLIPPKSSVRSER